MELPERLPLDQEDAMQQTVEKLVARRSRGNVVPIYNRKQIEQNMLEVFELVGGVPRLAMWANEPTNYGKFIDLLTRLAPKNVPERGLLDADKIIFQSQLPPSELNKGNVPRAPVMIEQDKEDN